MNTAASSWELLKLCGHMDKSLARSHYVHPELDNLPHPFISCKIQGFG